MRKENIILSVIMPLYNVSKTIELAIDSILMQKTIFDYEIIAVDDKSTDNTLEILKQYAKKYPHIKIIEHDKNYGNAMAFYNGLRTSSGKYFCVLDGDDYYSVKNKLQKQVDFLEGDKEELYTAVVHKYLRINEEGKVLKDAQVFSKITEYNYEDFVNQNFYYHTSAFMYRNIFRGQVPECFKEEIYRGDSPRTFTHIFATKGKVKVLDFFGSVYFYNGNGIWSKTSPEEQKNRNIKMWEFFGEKFQSKLEKDKYNSVIEYRKSRPSAPISECCWLSIDGCLNRIKELANQYAFKDIEFISNSLYKSTFVDSFSESLGFASAAFKKIIPSKPLEPNQDNVLITIANLTATNDDVFSTIQEIMKMSSEKKVYLLLTEVDNFENIDEKLSRKLKEFPNLTLLFGQSDPEGRLNKLIDTIIDLKPAKIYHCPERNNLHIAALAQSAFGENIHILPSDHGFVLGLDNTSYDGYIAKNIGEQNIEHSRSYGNRLVEISNVESMLKIKIDWSTGEKAEDTPSFLQRIFSIRNTCDKRHKILMIAGIKIKIKRFK